MTRKCCVGCATEAEGASGVYAAAAVRASCSFHPTVRYTIVCTLVLLLLQISSLLIFFHQIVSLVIIFAFV